MALIRHGDPSVVVLGRSKMCVLDRLKMVVPDQAESLMTSADSALADGGWLRIGNWQVAPPLTQLSRKMGIIENALSAPVARVRSFISR